MKKRKKVLIGWVHPSWYRWFSFHRWDKEEKSYYSYSPCIYKKDLWKSGLPSSKVRITIEEILPNDGRLQKELKQ